jgi:hypothetical protein
LPDRSFTEEACRVELGFETVGNATLILHDGGPVLATDPWIAGAAYFGSWGLAHEIPAAQIEAVKQCKYIWVSHGHPDHLSGDSLALLKDKILLLPDHRGSRVLDDLKAQGFKVQVMEDRTWLAISPRVRVLCIADYNQDAILLADVNGRLVVNMNDAGDRGCGGFVRKIIKQYPRSFLLTLVGRGADMMNFFGEDGQRFLPPPKSQLGATLSNRTAYWGATAAIPFSAMHRFQRTDSVWAEPYASQIEEYPIGYDRSRSELLPGYVQYNCLNDDVTPLNPSRSKQELHDPKEFGDDWSERLEPEEKQQLRAYFEKFEHLRKDVDYLRFIVGGEETVIDLRKSQFNRGLTFEVPRGSLMTSVKYEVFDDLLIGNFMKVTLHGEWGPNRLYPDFTPWVGKYGDNGRARTLQELKDYFQSYRDREPLDYYRHRFETGFLMPFQEATASAIRSRLGANSAFFRMAKTAWWGSRKRFF